MDMSSSASSPKYFILLISSELFQFKAGIFVKYPCVYVSMCICRASLTYLRNRYGGTWSLVLTFVPHLAYVDVSNSLNKSASITTLATGIL